MKRTPAIFCSLILFTAVSIHARGGTTSTAAVTSKVLFVAADPVTPNVPAGAPVIFGDVAGFADSTYVNNGDVTSIFQTGNEWELNTLSSATRRMWINLGTSDFSGSYYPSRFVTHCFATNNAIPVGSLTAAGQSTVCGVTFRFDPAPGVYYRVSMNTSNVSSGDAIVKDGVTTENVRFTCTAASNGQCTAWTGEPADTNGDGRSLARLTKFVTVKGKTTTTNVGYYNVIVRIEITRP